MCYINLDVGANCISFIESNKSYFKKERVKVWSSIQKAFQLSVMTYYFFTSKISTYSRRIKMPQIKKHRKLKYYFCLSLPLFHQPPSMPHLRQQRRQQLRPVFWVSDEEQVVGATAENFCFGRLIIASVEAAMPMCPFYPLSRIRDWNFFSQQNTQKKFTTFSSHSVCARLKWNRHP